MEINDLTYEIRGAIFEVHNELGPGLFESVYEAALVMELADRGLSVKNQVDLPVIYKEINLGLGFRIDILVNDSVIIEIKSVETLHNVHKKQLINYLKLSEKKIGILVNFNVDKLENKISLVRIANLKLCKKIIYVVKKKLHE